MKIEKQSTTILIVDDTQHNVQVLSQLIRVAGYRVIAAFNGKDALDLASKRKPDLVLLDILMPEMDGFQVCELFKKNNDLKNIPIIFLSALSDAESKIKGFKVGGIDYITKPFHREEVLARIDLHLTLQKLEEERKKNIKELENREKNLKSLNRAKDEVMRIVSHDIRNPLTGIIGVANMIQNQDDLSKGELRGMMEMIEQSSQELLKLVNDVLEADFVESGGFNLNLEKVDITHIVSKTVELHRPSAYSKSIDLFVNIQNEIPPVQIDVQKMNQILGNLISNALKYTPLGGQIEVGVGYCSKNQNGQGDLTISVTDNGIGISENDIPILFERYNKNRRPGIHGEKGTGLGLNIVKRFVEMHDGNIEVHSSKGEGTEFKITLPAN
ncbi:MAG TPA: hybrid sensor histidine kinase/response regulator [Balneolales bacterium]|nr:hybrid sensor histidine kinase/response regulator [Balneolales bacterium]